MEQQWEDMTWQERREERFKKWLNPTGVKFSSPEAAKKYKERATRLIKAIKMEIPDRVPVHIPPGAMVAYYSGLTLKEVLYDHTKIKSAWIKYLRDFDIDSNEGPGFFSGRANEILGSKASRWPGYGLPETATMNQFVETEYMKADEYDLFLDNEFDFGLRYFLPRAWGAFEPFADSPPLSSYQGLPQQLMMMALDPRFQKFFKAIREAAEENAKHQKVLAECARISLEEGFPSGIGSFSQAPFDTIADMLRGTRGAALDMYRQPEKLLETLEVITQRNIKTAVNIAKFSISPIVFIPMHKGEDSFMSIKQFEKFYWPTFRKLLLGLSNEGLVPMMVIDGSYNEQRLNIIKDLPKSSVVWTMEKTNMFKAKDILGDSACISGNVLASQLYTQDAKQIKEYCRKLIEYCAPGGGYILSLGSGVDRCDPAKLQAVIEAAKEYGVYK
jgi:uroporphyrinogen-III decarboxylase